MNFLERIVRRPVTVSMCILAIVLFGFVAVKNMGLNLLPHLDYPKVAIVTPYPNADPLTVEQEVTIPIENVLATVAGLTRIESQSLEHVSVILATFDWDTDVSEAIDQLHAHLSLLALQLPADAQSPVVSKLDPAQLPMMMIGLTGDQEIHELTAIADQLIRPNLEAIPGVAQVSVLGGIRPQITVEYYDEELALFEVTPYHLLLALEAQNFATSAGSLHRTSEGRVIDTLAYVGNPIDDIDELRTLSIGVGVSVAHVADVEPEFTSPEGFTRVNGTRAVLIRVLPQAGINTVAVAQQIQDALAQVNADPDIDVTLHVVSDQSEMIVESTSNLSQTIVIGGLLAFAILLLFLRNWRSLLIIGISIPLSLLVTFLLLHGLGYTLNIMTLGGLAIAVGMLVDNSIVVLENIFRLRAEGKGLIPAAVEGTREMAGSITSATVTTVAVFVPLTFAQSTAGHLFKELAIAVCLALLSSLAIALLVIPALAVQLRIREGQGSDTGAAGNSSSKTSRSTSVDSGGPLQARYRRLVTQAIQRPLVTVAIVVVTGLLLVLIPGRMATEFLPPMDGSLVNIEINLPPGTPIERTSEIVAALEEHLMAYPEVKTLATYGGDQGGQSIFDLMNATPASSARVTALLSPPESRNRSAFDIAAAIETALENILPADAAYRVSADRATDSLGDEFAMAATVRLRGPDTGVLERLAVQVAEQMRNTPGFYEVVSTADERHPQLFYEIFRDRAALAGMSTQQVALYARLANTGYTATQLLLDGRITPVVVRPKNADLDSLMVYREPASITDYHPPFPFTELVSTTIERSVPRALERVDRQPAITVSAQLDGLDISSSRRHVETILDSLELPFGYEATLIGIHATLDETFDDLGLALLLAVLFVFILLAAQFESIRHPGLILIAIPLATIGGFIALLIAGHHLSVPALIGLISLAGVSVNNNIVLVDTMNRLRREGLDLDEAIATSCAIRLRPILMTTLTTILALIPLAFQMGTGPGVDIQAPLAVAMTGGLISSALLTLIVTPTLYRMLSRPARTHTPSVGTPSIGASH